MTHPDVLQAFVIGVPDARTNEAAVAYVIPRPGAALTDDALIAHCRGRIASFKVPRHVRIVADVPRTPGPHGDKVQKGKLRELFLAESAGSGARAEGAWRLTSRRPPRPRHIRTICVWMVSESRRPLASVTRVCQTWVRLPRWSGVDSARTTPSRPAAKKLVLDSSVVVPAPGGRFRTVAVAPIVSASAISVPPCRLPPTVRISSRMTQLGDDAVRRRLDDAHAQEIGQRALEPLGDLGGIDLHGLHLRKWVRFIVHDGRRPMGRNYPAGSGRGALAAPGPRARRRWRAFQDRQDPEAEKANPHEKHAMVAHAATTYQP